MNKLCQVAHCQGARWLIRGTDNHDDDDDAAGFYVIGNRFLCICQVEPMLSGKI